MQEKEPTIEYEPNPEKKREIPEIKNNYSAKEINKDNLKEERVEFERKKKERKEKEVAYKKEIQGLIDLAEKEGFSKAQKRAEKMSKKKGSIIIDLFHDRYSQEKD